MQHVLLKNIDDLNEKAKNMTADRTLLIREIATKAEELQSLDTKIRDTHDAIANLVDNFNRSKPTE